MSCTSCNIPLKACATGLIASAISNCDVTNALCLLASNSCADAFLTCSTNSLLAPFSLIKAIAFSSEPVFSTNLR